MFDLKTVECSRCPTSIVLMQTYGVVTPYGLRVHGPMVEGLRKEPAPLGPHICKECRESIRPSVDLDPEHPLIVQIDDVLFDNR